MLAKCSSEFFFVMCAMCPCASVRVSLRLRACLFSQLCLGLHVLQMASEV